MYINGDNLVVKHNTQKPEPTCKKKSHAICYNVVRESVAMGESLTGPIIKAENPADLSTKIMVDNAI